jgi:hypothetical protein
VPRALLLALALSCLGCDAQLTNRADAYPVVAGAIDLKWTPTITGVRSVEFKINGTTLGRDDDPSDGFSVELDSTKLSNGLQTIAIIARGATNQILLSLEHSVLIAN